MSPAPPSAHTPPRAPSIRARLAAALAVWTLGWSLAVGAVAWLAAEHEVGELMDDGLRAAAELVAHELRQPAAASSPSAAPGGSVATAAEATTAPSPTPTPTPMPTAPAANGPHDARMAWQLVAADGRLLQRSAAAPSEPWHAAAAPGRSDLPDWHLHGLALGPDGRMLYIAQTRAERQEAGREVAVGAIVAALAVGGLGHLWLRARVRAELAPLQQLSDRLRQWVSDERWAPAAAAPPAGPLAAGPGPLGGAQRRELEPVHQAIEALADALALRIANERAFSAQAAHALRTPLAGIDAQLAVVLRDCPPPLRERLQRVRGAAGRLQTVVSALLGLFRSAAALERRPVALAPLLARLPSPTLQVDCPPDAQVWADADLLAAALANLIDNAQRHGAQHLRVELPAPVGSRLRLHDDGPGIDEARRAALQTALDRQQLDDSAGLGLGLLLADRVARAHGGQVRLLAAARGFSVELGLAPDIDHPTRAHPSHHAT